MVPASSVNPANWVILVDAIFEMTRITQKRLTSMVNRKEGTETGLIGCIGLLSWWVYWVDEFFISTPPYFILIVPPPQNEGESKTILLFYFFSFISSFCGSSSWNFSVTMRISGRAFVRTGGHQVPTPEETKICVLPFCIYPRASSKTCETI
jgi:hypothetical protein